MGWMINTNVVSGVIEIFDDEANNVASVYGRTENEAISKASVMACAPDLHQALADLVELAKKNLPDHLQAQLRPFEKTLNKVSEMYEHTRRKS